MSHYIVTLGREGATGAATWVACTAGSLADFMESKHIYQNVGVV